MGQTLWSFYIKEDSYYCGGENELGNRTVSSNEKNPEFKRPLLRAFRTYQIPTFLLSVAIYVTSFMVISEIPTGM
jgi:hypothetical protein